MTGAELAIVAACFEGFAIACAIAWIFVLYVRLSMVDACEKNATERVADMRERCNRLDVQLAACGTAALGFVRDSQIANEESYGWSIVYQDVVALRREVEALRQARDHALEMLLIHDLEAATVASTILRMSKRVVGPGARRVEEDES